MAYVTGWTKGEAVVNRMSLVGLKAKADEGQCQSKIDYFARPTSPSPTMPTVGHISVIIEVTYDFTCPGGVSCFDLAR